MEEPEELLFKVVREQREDFERELSKKAQDGYVPVSNLVIHQDSEGVIMYSILTQKTELVRV